MPRGESVGENGSEQCAPEERKHSGDGVDCARVRKVEKCGHGRNEKGEDGDKEKPVCLCPLKDEMYSLQRLVRCMQRKKAERIQGPQRLCSRGSPEQTTETW